MARTAVKKKPEFEASLIEAWYDDPDQFDPFSGHNSFPSGHSTVAFADAEALDRETSARWVPWAAYPLASLVGWSRVRDDKHWGSDVVAGAALGYWAARKTEDFMRARGLGGGGIHAFLSPRANGGRIGGRWIF